MALVNMNYKEDDDGFVQRQIVFTRVRYGRALSHDGQEAAWNEYERLCNAKYERLKKQWAAEGTNY